MKGIHLYCRFGKVIGVILLTIGIGALVWEMFHYESGKNLYFIGDGEQQLHLWNGIELGAVYSGILTLALGIFHIFYVKPINNIKNSPNQSLKGRM
jgi:hypothetical protein